MNHYKVIINYQQHN